MTNMKNVIVKENFQSKLPSGHPAIPLLEGFGNRVIGVVFDDFGDVIEVRVQNSSYRLPLITIGNQSYPTPILVSKEIDDCLGEPPQPVDVTYVEPTMPVQHTREERIVHLCKCLFSDAIPVKSLGLMMSMTDCELQQMMDDYNKINNHDVAKILDKLQVLENKINVLVNEKSQLQSELNNHQKASENFSAKYRAILN